MITEDKKDYVSKLESCWAVASQLAACVRGSGALEKVEPNVSRVVEFNTSPRLLKHKIDVMTGKEESLLSTVFNDEESAFREENSEILEELDETCNIYGIHKCVKEELSPDGMKGFYDNLEVNYSPVKDWNLFKNERGLHNYKD